MGNPKMIAALKLILCEKRELPLLLSLLWPNSYLLLIRGPSVRGAGGGPSTQGPPERAQHMAQGRAQPMSIGNRLGKQ